MRVIKYFSGAFGSPTMFFTENDGENEQMFWGSDRLILKEYFFKNIVVHFSFLAIIDAF